MTTTVLNRKKAARIAVGPDSNGMLMTPAEFDRAEFEEGWRYELINGVLIVSSVPSMSEADPNDELGHWLRTYKQNHPRGAFLDATAPERLVHTGRNRRRVDRCIWAGLGRRPKPSELPTIAVEFVSSGNRNRERDFVAKRDEYLRVKIKEYWVIDRFKRQMVVFTRSGGKTRSQTVQEDGIYTTPLLPGFELPLRKLLVLADSWSKKESSVA